MSSITEIESAVARLSREELARFRSWFADFDADAWDRQFEADAAAGRLDALGDEALRDLDEGRCRDLCRASCRVSWRTAASFAIFFVAPCLFYPPFEPCLKRWVVWLRRRAVGPSVGIRVHAGVLVLKSPVHDGLL
jgi:hypothetical protein